MREQAWQGAAGAVKVVTMPMGFDFAECRAVLLRGVLAALRPRADVIRAMEQADGGRLPAVTGGALDLAPWYGGVGLALWLSSDPRDEERRHRSVEWRHFNFISKENCEALVPAVAGQPGLMAGSLSEANRWPVRNTTIDPSST